jgi:hypothetical protein
MMWMVDIRDFRHVTVAIAYFLYLLLLSFRPSFNCSYYPIFGAVPWRRQSPFSQLSEFDPRPDNNSLNFTSRFWPIPYLDFVVCKFYRVDIYCEQAYTNSSNSPLCV